MSKELYSAIGEYYNIPKEDLCFDRIVGMYNKQIRKILDKKGISQKELSEITGLKEAYLSRVLSGDQNFTMRSIAKMLVGLDADLRLKIKLNQIEENKTEVLSQESFTAHKINNFKETQQQSNKKIDDYIPLESLINSKGSTDECLAA